MTELRSVLHEVRKDLLDLTARNRLLAAPRGSRRASSIEVVGERSDAVYEILVRKRRSMGFRGQADAASEPEDDDPFRLPPLDPHPAGVAGPLPHQLDRWLQTALPPERLQSRLLKLAYEARSLHEERGVHVLYLALGFLTWFEAPQAETPRHAPLILLPLRLERAGALERFRVRATDDEIVANVCLSEKLARDFGLVTPTLPDQDDLDPRAWFRAISEVVEGEPRFVVEPDAMMLGLFSFTRLLMWRDLDPATWPGEAPLEHHPLLRSVLVDRFQDDPGFDDRCDLDRLLPARETVHVLDADGSQALAIEAARRGHNLLIQGPPGTGKSQTIANLIAASVHAGKRVLFVAEKMAALDVVRRRLEALDLGCLLLELHSRRASRSALIDELRRTLELGRPHAPEAADAAAELEHSRTVLNTYARALHRPIEPARFTPFELIGHLVRLGPIDTQGIVLPIERLERAEFERCRGLIAALGRRLERVGDSRAHPWRGVAPGALMPADQHRLCGRARALGEGVQALRMVACRLAAELGEGDLEGATIDDIEPVLDTAEFVALAPEAIDSDALLDPIWQDGRDDIARLALAGQAYAALKDELEGWLSEAALAGDVREPAARHARLAGRWWRFLVPGWRACRGQVDALFRGPPPPLDERLEILERLTGLQAAARHLAANGALGRSAFGRAWRGEASAFDTLAELERWERDGRAPHLLSQAPQRLARLARPARVAELGAQAQRLLLSVRHDLERLFADLALDPRQAFGETDIQGLPLGALEERLRAWAADGDGLQDWIALRHESEAARRAGLGPLVDALLDGRVAGPDAGPVFETIVYERLLRAALTAEPALQAFDAVGLDERLERFRALDRRRIELARAEVALAHDRGLPRASGQGGQLGLLEQEFRKKRRHLSIRRLIAGAGEAIQAIKPVFMMSPLSVAEFLPPGALAFDLLLIDEASQVEPVDALGAIARARQIVVVGDERQLPPTPFFRERATDPPPEEDPAASQAAPRDLESILGLCAARGVPQRMLRWHYRSRHPSLIAVSNHAFYDDRMLVVPSPMAAAADRGIAFHYLSDAVYERGGSRTNPKEAGWIARAVLEHAEARPDLSLGVGCFSVQQRDRILAELERLRRAAPELEPFFEDDGPEPFFVKNLETLQGDERDVIMISVGYGPDPSGYLAMSFGPLNADGGERRLNVLISRARRKLEVVSSIRAADIALERSAKPGVRTLKTFLHYAETGVLETPEATGREPDSAFEVAVGAALRAAGLEVVHQVGSAGFFVDLAVLDPERPGRYLLGIECDGAAWHAAPWARDRDRLRQQVLEDQGWILHRIWSGDWFRRPEAALARALAAVEEARATWRARDQASRISSPAGGRRSIARAPGEPRDGPEPDAAQPYREADVAIEPVEPHAMDPGVLLEAVVRIVAVEGPVHRDEIARRLVRLVGLSRTGRRVAEVVVAALERAVAAGRLDVEGAFYALAGRPVVVRDRSGSRSSTLRHPSMLPPAEVRAAMIRLIRVRIGLSPEDAVIQTSRMLGFQSTSAGLREVIEAVRDRLIDDGVLDPDERGLLRERRPAA